MPPAIFRAGSEICSTLRMNSPATTNKSATMAATMTVRNAICRRRAASAPLVTVAYTISAFSGPTVINRMTTTSTNPIGMKLSRWTAECAELSIVLRTARRTQPASEPPAPSSEFCLRIDPASLRRQAATGRGSAIGHQYRMLLVMSPTLRRRFVVVSAAALLLLPAAEARAEETSDQPTAAVTAEPACTAAAAVTSDDPTALVALCRPQAEAGDAQAQYALGVAHYVGVGAPLDYVEAAHWYRMAAEQDYVEAQVRLGAMYLMGRGVERDFAQAADWYQKAAEQGDVEAQNALGGLYLTGTGVPEDAREAARWYRLAAEQGDPEAQYFMGAFYYDGNGVAQDYEQAWRWFRLSADQGDLEARFMLGRLYEKGNGVPASAAKAARWYRDAAEQGHGRAQAALGALLTQDRDDLDADRSEAYLWLSLAAAQGVEAAVAEREALLLAMTPEELAEGEDRLAAWLGADE